MVTRLLVPLAFVLLTGCSTVSTGNPGLDAYRAQLRQQQLDKARQTPSLYRGLR